MQLCRRRPRKCHGAQDLALATAALRAANWLPLCKREERNLQIEAADERVSQERRGQAGMGGRRSARGVEMVEWKRATRTALRTATLTKARSDVQGDNCSSQHRSRRSSSKSVAAEAAAQAKAATAAAVKQAVLKLLQIVHVVARRVTVKVKAAANPAEAQDRRQVVGNAARPYRHHRRRLVARVSFHPARQLVAPWAETRPVGNPVQAEPCRAMVWAQQPLTAAGMAKLIATASVKVAPSSRGYNSQSCRRLLGL
mmetsp:Transcript_21076/g.34788  ORF Transcript_21076/g.34788 Transcript_21076/m.34788 type:complete len:256 (+) Transcript_21076:217-984(+)